MGAGGEIEYADSAPFENMKPEMTTSVELGTEWRFLNDRISFSGTYYKTNTRNQFFKLPAKSGDKYAYRYVNAGDIQNIGWEVSASALPVVGKDFEWKSSLNYSTNKNKVVRLHEELPVFIYGPRGFSSSYAMKLVEGGSLGIFMGKHSAVMRTSISFMKRKAAKKVCPQVEGEGNLIKVGNANPKFTMSWNNTFTYRNLFSFISDR